MLNGSASFLTRTVYARDSTSMKAKRVQSATMPTADQFADYFIARTRTENRQMSAYKLQKLLYYTQAWSLSERDRPAFREEVRAWKDGPVVPAIYKRFRESYFVESTVPGPHGLDAADQRHAEAIWLMYRELDGDQLAAMTHREQPWIDARKGYADHARSDVPIKESLMREECQRQMADTDQALLNLAQRLAG